MNIGLIRGGQLGLMLIEAGMRYSDHFFVLDSDPDAPCKYFCRDFQEGDYLNPEAIEAFGKDLDAVILEFENVSIEGLQRLEKRGVKVFPSSAVLASIQDKGHQKLFFKENNLPTSDFILIDHKSELSQYTSRLPAVLKLRRGGYDGKGVVILKELSDCPEGWTEGLLLEEKVAIQKELAVVVVRDQSGNMTVYPTVEMVFHEGQNMLDLLVAPARISEKESLQAAEIAKKTAEAYNIVGLLAVEMFLTNKGDILINEVAPRVHNSGHCTMESSSSSQFDQLMRIAHQLPLGDTNLISPVAMVNLIGHPNHEGPVIYEGMEEALAQPDVYLHLYGKQETRPYRKMGHMTVLDKNLETAMERARMIQKSLIVRS